MKPCTDRKRYVSKAIAVQRSLSPTRRHRESVPTARFRIGPGVCSPPRPGEAGRTACYAEHSTRRKYCPFLSESGRGASSVELSADATHVRFSAFPVSPREVGDVRLPIAELFASDRVEDVAHAFYRAAKMLPTLGALEELRMGGAFERRRETCARDLARRASALSQLRSTCERDAELQRGARRFLRATFHFAMYARRWRGPGFPYPVEREGEPLSSAPSLRGMGVNVTPSGEVRLKNGSGADRLEAGRLVTMVRACLKAAFLALDSLDEPRRRFLRSHLVCALPYRGVNGRWPSEERLCTVLFGAPRDGSVATDSAMVLHSCGLMSEVLYKTEPQWMKYEHELSDV